MHGIEKRLLMRHLLEQGLAKSAVARQLGISRRTVYNWIEAGELDRDPDDHEVQYGPRPPVPSILDSYKDAIDARLAEYPELSAAQLYREVRAEGYAGSYAQVKRHVGNVRPKTRGRAGRAESGRLS